MRLLRRLDVFQDANVRLVQVMVVFAALSVVQSPLFAQSLVFKDVATESGVDVTFHTGSRNKHDLPEIMGGGVGLIDIDGDGLLDLFFPNGGPIVAGPGLHDPPCRLFHNKGQWRFQEITATAQLPGPSYAMGCAVGDYDGDGRDDLFVTGWRDQRLYRNLGGGKFADVTTSAGLTSRLWSTSAAFADLDQDGDLDLYVCNYLRYDPAKAPYCGAPDGLRDYCGPEEFDAEPDRLYRNDGDGTFTETSKSAGISDPNGRGLGVVVANLIGDSRLDIFVANDGTACRLYENRGAMRFVEVGTSAGIALDGEGRSLAGMGVSVGDADGDGHLDLLATNFLGRSTILFRNQGAGLFADESRRSGLTAGTRSVLGFGLGIEDFDGDGDLDLFQANGHVLDRARLGQDFTMKSTLLRNDQGRFVDTSKNAGAFFDRPMLGRGLAVGDLDNDGRPDVVIVPLDGPVAILRNQSEGGRLTKITLEGKRTSIGAIVKAKVGAGTRTFTLAGGGSYLTSSDRRISLGLGSAILKEVEVQWPSGKIEWFPVRDRPVSLRLVEGQGHSPQECRVGPDNPFP